MTKPLLHDDLAAIATFHFWSDLRNQSILFTGASGFFGSWLLESYLFAADTWNLAGKALALTRDARRFAQKLPHLAAHPNVEILEGDARSFSAPPGSLDIVIHSLVPDSGTSLEEADDFFSAATTNLLRLARERDCRHFLLCSTGAVYQPASPSRPFAEEDALVPLNGPVKYGQIRRKVEEQCLCAVAENAVPVKIARGFAFAGPRLPLDANFAIGNFIRDALQGGPIIVQGDGTAVRSYLYAADMTIWLWTILLKGTPGQTYNVGSDETISIADLARTIGKSLGVETKILGASKPGAAPSWYVPCIKKAASDFGLTTSTSLRESVGKNVQWTDEIYKERLIVDGSKSYIERKRSSKLAPLKNEPGST